MNDDESGISKGVQTIIVYTIGALLLWSGGTNMYMLVQMTQVQSDIRAIVEKQKEIVPRAENEMRYTAIERKQAENSETIARINQNLLEKVCK